MFRRATQPPIHKKVEPLGFPAKTGAFRYGHQNGVMPALQSPRLLRAWAMADAHAMSPLRAVGSRGHIALRSVNHYKAFSQQSGRPTSKPGLQVLAQQLPKCNARCADSIADLVPKHDAIAADPPRKPHAKVTQGVSQKYIVGPPVYHSRPSLTLDRPTVCHDVSECTEMSPLRRTQ